MTHTKPAQEASAEWLKRKARQVQIESRHKELHLLFVEQIKDAGLPLPVAELLFAHPRRWRFDFAWIELMIAVEIQGGNYVQGRHNRAEGYAGDCEKANMATFLGWDIYRFTSEQVEDGTALAWVKRALEATRTRRSSSIC